MTVQALRAFINRHAVASAALGAVGAALDARTSGAPLAPALAARVQELLGALGGGNLLDDVSPEDAGPLLAELRHTLPLDAKLLYAHTREIGWNHSEPGILQAVGDFSRAHAAMLTRNVVPALEGLPERFAAPDAAFLDIGVGVAGTAIGMAQAWPKLRVVGIDPWQPALALARANVEQAGLRDRIELREQVAESLDDERVFDLAWMPMVFMPEPVVPAGVERTLRSLRPGGWMVLVCFADFAQFEPQAAALWRLRATMFGGPAWLPSDGERLLRDKGFVEVRTLPTPPHVPIGMVVGRRTPS